MRSRFSSQSPQNALQRAGFVNERLITIINTIHNPNLDQSRQISPYLPPLHPPFPSTPYPHPTRSPHSLSRPSTTLITFQSAGFVNERLITIINAIHNPNLDISREISPDIHTSLPPSQPSPSPLPFNTISTPHSITPSLAEPSNPPIALQLADFVNERLITIIHAIHNPNLDQSREISPSPPTSPSPPSLQHPTQSPHHSPNPQPPQ